MESQSNKNIKRKIEGAGFSIEDGFSSQEIEQEQIIYTIPEHMQEVTVGIEENKIASQKSQTRQVITKSYSLQPDMIGGWTPKIQFLKPIPLIFSNSQFDQMVDAALLKKKRYLPSSDQIDQSQNLQVCYLGARYQTTYYAWYDKQFQFPYKHLSAPKNIFFTDRAFVGQHWNAEKPNVLRFDSLFQAGNLDCVIKVGQFQYDLFMRVDSNTKGHLQWFNFRISNLEVGKAYKLNICNFQKGKNLYNRGMRPYLYSTQKFDNQRMGWHQLPGQVKYRKKISKSQKYLQFQMSQRYYQLTFEISTNYEKDELQLAYCVPYTYTRMKKYLNQLRQETLSKNICTMRKLCTSLGGHEVDELTITENTNEQQNCFKSKTKLQKKVVFITGRCHPGQSNGSWMLEGVIDFLCGATEAAYFLRKNVIFKVVPMLNPDGVILGNYRTGLFGKDFNRQFNSPDKDIFPQIYHLKQMFWSYKKIYSQNAFIYLDFHGHSIKKNVFAYGPEYPITHKNYYESRMICKFIAMKSKMFRYHSCIFKIAESKESTGRAIFLKNHKIPFTFTIQASNGSYYDQDCIQNKDFDEFKWKQIGQKVIQGVSDYMKLVLQMERIRNQKLQQRKQILLKNRERLKVKKSKNQAELGYLTSMGFRKCKTLNNQDQSLKSYYGEAQNYYVQDMVNQIKGFEESDRLKQIFDEINKEKDLVEADKDKSQKQSDDEISQGDSDHESKDDLDESRQKELLLIIKQRKKSKLTKKKTVGSEVTKQQIRQQETNEQEDQQLSEKIGKLNQKIGSKDILMRKYLWKKKNSAYSSLSPKKEESISTAAKIVNFNFSLNPVQCSSTSFNNTNGNNNNFQSTSFTSKSSSNCLNLKAEEKGTKYPKNNQSRMMEYSQTFKKTFISVQKQILRRDSYKRYLVSLNNQSQGKQKNNWVIENVRGKKIGQIQQPESFKYPSKEQQRNYRSQGKSSEMKSGKKNSNRFNRNLKTAKESIQSEIINIEIEDKEYLHDLQSTAKDLTIKGTFSPPIQQKYQFK